MAGLVVLSAISLHVHKSQGANLDAVFARVLVDYVSQCAE